jgi:hypothetical protein
MEDVLYILKTSFLNEQLDEIVIEGLKNTKLFNLSWEIQKKFIV